MADSGVNITEGSGQVVDSRTEGTNGNHRQVVVLGDPATNAGVAPVDATNGLAVDNKTLPPGASTEAHQVTQNGYIDQIEGYVDGIEGSLTTLIGAVKVEDAAETAGGGLMMAGSVRRDTAASSAGTTGDNATINTDSVGAMWTRDTATLVDDAVFTPGTSRVMPLGLQADEASTDSVDEGDVGTPRMTLDRKQIVTPQSHTNGGATPHKLVSAASTNATSLKASAGQIYSIACFNINAAVRYLKLYNKASAPTVGTDVPVQVYAIPGATTGGGFTLSFSTGMEFTTGIAYALTVGITDADNTAVAASEILVNITHK